VLLCRAAGSNGAALCHCFSTGAGGCSNVSQRRPDFVFRLEEGLPAFLTIILIPLTFSITQGILWGFISHVALYLLVGRHKEIHPMMYARALISIGLLLLESLR